MKPIECDEFELKLSRLCEMEAECFRDKEPYSEAILSAHLEKPDAITIIEDYGYVLGNVCIDECELYRIAVLPRERSKGLGLALMRAFLAECGGLNVKTVFLEVGEKNLPAGKLYEKCGFARVGLRKGYYADDNAVVMRLTMG